MQMTIASSSDINLRGLTESEVNARRQRGLGNNVRLDASRSYRQIVRENVFTFLNIVLFGIGVVLVLLGLYNDALFSVGIAAFNVIVGVTQEIRAKRALDKIALLTRPKATVIREGQAQIIDPEAIVVGDILQVASGDQIVVDGRVVSEGRMDVDESLLTGESDLIPKRVGDQVFAGSFCVNGSAYYEVEKVGHDSLAGKITSGARAFKNVKTPLQMDIDLVIRFLLALTSFLAVIFAVRSVVIQLPLTETARIAAVVTGLIPNGLILMTSVSYGMGAVRMAGRGALIQGSNAVESMSRVNILCLDKTGTLTANRINLDQTHSHNTPDAEFRRILGIYAASTNPRNRTTEALHTVLNGEKRRFAEEIPFSSERKWSALSFDEPDFKGVYVLGAPENLRQFLQEESDLGSEIHQWAEKGLRVLLFAHHSEVTPLRDSLGQPQLPPDLTPMGVLSFSDELRPEAKTTLAGFAETGIRLKIISGDNPNTVAALAKQAGFSGEFQVVSGLDLEELTDEQFGLAAENSTVFGRITPQQKERLVDTLRERGHYVAMIGDGVNDVLSLKKAQIGIAMQSGSQATRGVADIILMGDSFAALPPAFREGQRIINGMLDIMRLFLARVLYQAIIIVAVAIMGLGFPIIPAHTTILTLFTVGIPTLALAAWARPGTPPGNLIHSIIRFVLPAGATIATFATALFLLYGLEVVTIAGQESLATARTVLTAFTTLAGLLLIIFVEPPTHFLATGEEFSGDWRPTLMAGILFVVFMVINFQPGLREFFELTALELRDWLILFGAVAVWAAILQVFWRSNLTERFLRL